MAKTSRRNCLMGVTSFRRYAPGQIGIRFGRVFQLPERCLFVNSCIQAVIAAHISRFQKTFRNAAFRFPCPCPSKTGHPPAFLASFFCLLHASASIGWKRSHPASHPGWHCRAGQSQSGCFSDIQFQPAYSSSRAAFFSPPAAMQIALWARAPPA